jgi:hypothetical protein
MEVRVDFEWLDEFLKKIWALAVQNTLDKSMKKSIFLLEREAKLVTPVDTWLLRNSYETKFRPLEWQLRNFREYAPYVENRVWFLQEATWKAENQIQKIFEDDIKAMLNDLTK